MNKVILFLSLLAMSSLAEAAKPRQLEDKASMQVDLLVRTKSGQFRMDRVRKVGSSLFYNGIRIDSKDLPLIMTELRTLGRVEKDSAKSCRAGYYRHKVTVKAKSREQIGCTGSPRYASISKALSRVRKQALN